MKALVLVGGLGTRLYPLTYHVPKAMVPMVNVPFAERMVRYLTRFGVDEIIFSVCYLPDPIREHFEKHNTGAVKFHYVFEEKPLDTAGAIKNAERLLDGTFFVLNGDIFVDINLHDVMDFHRQRGAKITIALTPVDDPTAYGVVETDDTGRIRRFLEKPRWDQVTTNHINAGIYVFEEEVLARIPPNRPYSVERALYPHALEEGVPMFGFVSSDYWIDIGTHQKYLRAHRDTLRGCIKVEIPGEQIRDGVWVGADSHIAEGATIEPPVVIGRGCQIATGARLGPFAVLGDEVSVDKDACVAESVLWRGTRVGEGARLRECILGRSCVVQPGTRVETLTAFEDNSTV
ncbi:MAG: NDP-sugar synthase [Abditibacteriales bacterium]|nr:NDP-sugar synthase [Abditibacteriales bacterium]MDW8365011.1 NDP-sugar synthase [Abditibacteriales bacterium]